MKYLYILAFLVIANSSFAQIKVNGTVVGQNGEAIVGVVVSASNGSENKRTITDYDGNFEISLLEKGQYEVQFRFIGFKLQTQSFDFGKLDSYNLGKISLEEDAIQLQSVEVVGRSRTDYNSAYSFSASKMAIENREMPQAISTITKELISDRQAFQIADAVKAVSSVTSTGSYNHFNIRGLTQSEEGQVINGMRTRQYYFLQPITSNIERVEVIKGPSSVTFSSVDPGGTVNMVTKKPLAEDKREVSISAGSFSTIRATADMTGPLNESKTLLYRFNAGFQEAQSFRDVVQNNALLLSPSISYVPNETTALNTEIIYSNEVGNLDRGQPTLGSIDGTGNFDLNSTPISMNVGASSDYYASEQFMIMTNFTKAITRNIGFNASYMKQTWKEDLAEHRTTNSAVVDSLGNPIPTLIAMRYNERQQFWDTDNLSAYLNFDFESGAITNKVLIGYDLNKWRRTKRGGRTDARRYLKTDGTAGSYDPSNPDAYQFETVNGVTVPVSNVPFFDLENPDNGTRLTQDYVTAVATIPANLTTSHGAYIQDQFKIGKFSTLLNLRYEWFEDIYDIGGSAEKKRTNGSFIPRIGFTYEVTKNISAYATYLRGVQAQSNTVSLSPATEGFFWDFGILDSPNQFDPIQSELKEVGFKGLFLNGILQANFSAYRINKENIIIGENAYDINTLEATGEIQSQGFEFDVSGYVLRNLQLIASYGYVDATIENHFDENLIGERTGGSAIHTANFWGKYDFIETILEGFGIGLGAQYSGDKYTWYFYGADDRVKLPAYTVLDGALYYRPNNSDLQLTLKVNNLTGEKYWSGGLNQYRLAPGAPRNYLMTVTYKF
ncbi:TonB-dependent siderophore receptor [Reichenbachiella versicolor]|uniref:TonB-dependent siderophore receptor n=1 Tax=Reichenbachiella versicolor TaxID=1821036 RepID=UPI000D6E0944|nr:TonB-dependent siderophore receptor [Reichenbachiella versicolor]